MHLKSLTLKGFKSFASATTLRLEPGITCVVGPNGSGKSNVVDAISWVLGEQGAKALRGGKMEDVIFAGTSGRAPLGRAEVTLTIDNSDGALPIDYSEVSITRRMFRDGAGEYEINGNVLPAAGHPGAAVATPASAARCTSIVGQGQLDSRAAVQAGGPPRVHRGGRRRPQAPQAQGEGAAQARRDAGQPHPAHRPHRRAAPPAQAAGPAGRDRAAGPGRAVRAARRPAAAGRRRPRHPARRSWPARRPTRRSARARRAEVEEQLSVARVEQERLEAALAQDAPRLAAAQDTWYRLSALAERLRGTVRLAAGAHPPPRRPARSAPPAATRTSWRPRPTRSPSRRPSWSAAVAEARRRLADVARGARRARADAGRRRARTPGRRPRAGRPPGRAGHPRRAGRGAAQRGRGHRRGDRAAVRGAGRGPGAHRRRRGRAGAGPRRARHPGRGRRRRWSSAAAQAAEAHEAARARVAELVARERELEQQRAHWRARVDALSVGPGPPGRLRRAAGHRRRARPAVRAAHRRARGPHRGRRRARRAGRRAGRRVAGRGSDGPRSCCAPATPAGPRWSWPPRRQASHVRAHQAPTKVALPTSGRRPSGGGPSSSCAPSPLARRPCARLLRRRGRRRRPRRRPGRGRRRTRR